MIDTPQHHLATAAAAAAPATVGVGVSVISAIVSFCATNLPVMQFVAALFAMIAALVSTLWILRQWKKEVYKDTEQDPDKPTEVKKVA